MILANTIIMIKFLILKRTLCNVICRRSYVVGSRKEVKSTHRGLNTGQRRKSPFDRFLQWKKERELKEKRFKLKSISEAAFHNTPSRFQLVDLRSASFKSQLKAKNQTMNQEREKKHSRNFEEMGLMDPIIEALKSIKIMTPTDIQRQAIPLILRHSEILMAAETGSGKTLAYLVPLFHLLKAEEKSIKPERMSPRAVILVPSRELVQQTLKVLKNLCKFVHLSGTCMAPGMSPSQMAQSLDAPFDILVTVPSLLVSHIENKMLKTERWKYLIVDESDTLLDSEFEKGLGLIISSTLVSASLYARLVMASATITRPMNRLVLDLFPRMLRVITENLHKPSDVLRQRFYRVNGPGNAKMKMCVKLLSSEPTSRIMVFCNSQTSAQHLFDFIIEEALPSVGLLHGGLTSNERDSVLKAFNNGELNVLVSTDLGSRGLDTYNVNHVLLFDFPRNVIDYLHRVGRTGRAGKGGKISSFVSRKDENLFKFIQMAIYRHRPFSEVSQS